MIEESEVYKIGTLTRVHALRGELSFSFTDDVWDRVDAEYLVLRVDGILVPFFLEEYRFRGDSVALLKFLDIDTADSAQEFVGCDVYFPFSLTPEEEPEDMRLSYFTGFRVKDVNRGDLGVVSSVDDSTANVLFRVDGPSGELLIPAVDAFIRGVDHAARTVEMDLPEGLLDLNES